MRCLWLLLAVSLAAVVPRAGAAGFTVQVGTFEEPWRAEALVTEIAGEHPGQAKVLADPERGLQRVCVGWFSRRIDARLVRDALRERDERFEGAFVRSAPEGFLENPAHFLEFAPPIFTLPAENAAEMSIQRLDGISAYEELESVRQNEPRDEFRRALLLAFPNHEPDDPVRGYIQVQLSILEGYAGNFDLALGWVEPVAMGKVAASAEHLERALVRWAWFTHRTPGGRTTAYQAWREIERFAGSEEVRRRALVATTGLMMELAESGAGTHEEVRREVARNLEILPGSDVKNRAVLELMYSETYGRQPEPDYARSAQLQEEFLEKYTPLNEGGVVQRELNTALRQAGMFHRMAGNLETGRYYFERVLAEVPADTRDHFRGYHPHSQALLGLAILEEEAGNHAKGREYRARLVRDYPDQIAGRQALHRNPELLQYRLDMDE